MHAPQALWLSLLVAVPVVGLGVALAARLSAGSQRQRMWQGLFFVCLAAVAAAVVVSLAVRPGMWLLSAASFSTMVLTTTCDFGRSQGAEAW